MGFGVVSQVASEELVTYLLTVCWEKNVFALSKMGFTQMSEECKLRLFTSCDSLSSCHISVFRINSVWPCKEMSSFQWEVEAQPDF